MARTTEPKVRGIIANDSVIDLLPFIEAATTRTDYVDTCDTGNLLSDEQLLQIETWLAAHFYAHRDQLFESKGTQKARGKFQGKTDMGLSSTQYGQTAINLDISGCLAKVNRDLIEGSQKVGLQWLGTPVSGQIPYQDRD